MWGTKKILASALSILMIGMSAMSISACDLSGLTDSELDYLENVLKEQGLSLDEVLKQLRKLGYRGDADEFLLRVLEEGTLEKEEIEEWRNGHNNGRGPDWNNGNGNNSNNGVGPNGDNGNFNKGIWVEKVYIDEQGNLIIELGDGTIINLGRLFDANTGDVIEAYNGLEYVLSIDETYYILIGVGSCEDKKIVIPDTFEGLPVKEIGEEAFFLCDTLEQIEISNTIDKIGDYAFAGCTNLSEITFGNHIQEIGNYAFASVASITEVIIPDSVTIVGEGAFERCTNLDAIVLPDGITKIFSNTFVGTKYSLDYKNWDNNVLYVGKYLITAKDDVVFGKYNVKEGTLCIANSAFKDCDMKSLTIPDSVMYICNYAFWGSAGLTQIDIGENVKSIGYEAFYSADITTLFIPDSVESIGIGAFAYCTLTKIEVGVNNRNYCSVNGNLYNKEKTELIQFALNNGATSFEIPDGVTYIYPHALAYSFNLTAITIPESVVSVGTWAFYSCRNLEKVYYKGSLENWCNITFESEPLASPLCYGADLYIGNQLLTQLVIPESITVLKNFTFYGCQSIKDVQLHDNVVEIGHQTFESCDGLESIRIGGGVQNIEGFTFRFCDNLKEVIISRSVTRIGIAAFVGCENLTSLKFEGTVEEWNQIEKGSDWNGSVPAEQVVCTDGVVTL